MSDDELRKLAKNAAGFTHVAVPTDSLRRLLGLLPPSDDTDPVDVAWADDLGWDGRYGVYWPWWSRTVALYVVPDAAPRLEFEGRVVASPATRGHVRRLCAAIGPLKETT